MPHKLLLADDSVTIQRVIELTFADEDVDVIAVGDGKQAIERLQQDRPDIVLADIGMPERDGYEVASFIKGNPQLAHIPVLLLTGAFEPIDETRARSVGCDGVLVKPFEPQMVINRVRDLLAGRKPAGLWAANPALQAASAARPSAAPVPMSSYTQHRPLQPGRRQEPNRSRIILIVWTRHSAGRQNPRRLRRRSLSPPDRRARLSPYLSLHRNPTTGSARRRPHRQHPPRLHQRRTAMSSATGTRNSVAIRFVRRSRTRRHVQRWRLFP